jgi:tetratricopeptide (TPR) repeat protein
LATFWIYSPVFRGQWLWDDSDFLTSNPLMTDPEGLWKIWFQPGILIDYYPLTFTVQRLEWNLFGVETLGYHLANIILHLVSALLVWRLLEKLGVRLAWWGGLLFAVHPITVESVAWISELKNTLSLPPLLLAMNFWIDYDERRAPEHYRQALLLFLVSMLCKTSGMMLPVILLLYAWWKRGRIVRSDLKSSAPFFLVALVLGAIGTWLEHRQPGPPDFFAATWLSRLLTVGHETVHLLSLCIFPVNLLPVYPTGAITRLTAGEILVWLLLLGAAGAIWINRYGWGRHLVLGLGFFLLNLVPVLGYIFMNETRMVWSLDHLAYLPIIGLIGLAAASLSRLDESLPQAGHSCVMGAASMVMALLTLGSHNYAKKFHDPVALWTYAWQRNPGSWTVQANLGGALADVDRLSEAIEHDNAAILLNPLYDAVHFNLGVAWARSGRDPEAIQEFAAAIRLNPTLVPAYEEMGHALDRTHHLSDALASYRKAVELNPRRPSAHFFLGRALVDAGQLPEAIDQFEQTLLIEPDDSETHAALGETLLKTNQIPEAAAQLEQAMQLDPGNASSRSNLGVAFARMGRFPDAVEQFEAALRINPNDAGSHNNLGGIYLQSGRISDAIAEYQAALRIQPGFALAQNNLARAEAIAKTRGLPAPPK